MPSLAKETPTIPNETLNHAFDPTKLDAAKGEQVARSSSSPKPKSEPFTYVDLDNIDSELFCAICYDPLNDPVVMKCCAHTLCRACVGAVCSSCPLCRQNPMPYIVPPKIVTNMLSRIDVRCTICEMTVKRESYGTHVAQVCPVPCPNLCGVSQTRAGVEKHLEVCAFHYVACDAAAVGCTVSMRRCDIGEHHLECALLKPKALLARIQELDQEVKSLRTELDRRNSLLDPPNNETSNTEGGDFSFGPPSTANKWEEFDRTINSLLSKMSNANFVTLKDKFLAMREQFENDGSKLDVLAKVIYENAVYAPPRYAPLFAELSLVLWRAMNEPVAKDFLGALLGHCQRTFRFSFVTPSSLEGETADDKLEREYKRNSWLCNNVTFIGELFLRQLVSPTIVHGVIRALLCENGDSDGDLGKLETLQLEMCVKLLTTIQGFKAFPQELERAERYFDHLRKLAADASCDMRDRFLIMGLLDQKLKWVDEKEQ